MASFSAIFVRNIIPVAICTGSLQISAIISSLPMLTLMVGNFGCAWSRCCTGANISGTLAGGLGVTGFSEVMKSAPATARPTTTMTNQGFFS